MITPYNLALVLTRFAAFLFISFGILGLVFLMIFLFFFSLGAPEWFSQIIVPQAVQSALIAPVWLLWGCGLFRMSRRLATFIAKPYDSDKSPAQGLGGS